MKKPILLALGLFFALYNPSFAEKPWQPISEITEVEINIIEGATKRPSTHVLSYTEKFRVGAKDTIVLMLKNGEVRYYAHGSKSFTPQASEECNQTLCLEGYSIAQELALSQKFKDLWNKEYDVNDRTPEDLIAADAAMEEYLGLVSQNTAIDVEMVARKGNRYVEKITALFPYLDAGKILIFYERYIQSALTRDFQIRHEDMPNEDQLKQAAEEILAILQTSHEPFKFYVDTYSFLANHFPEKLAELKQQNKITN